MDGVAAAPDLEGRHGDDADDAADPVVDGLAAEKGTVAAVVLDQEEADEEAGGGNGDEQRQKEADGKRLPGRDPQHDERNGRDQDLEDAALAIGLAIARENLEPVACRPVSRSVL